MPHIPSCLKKRLTVDDPSHSSKPTDASPSPESLDSKPVNAKHLEKSTKETKGDDPPQKKEKKEKKLKNLKSFFGPGKVKASNNSTKKPNLAPKSNGDGNDHDEREDIVTPEESEIVDCTGADSKVDDSIQISEGNATQDKSDKAEVADAKDKDALEEADPNTMEVDDEGEKSGASKEKRMLAKLSNYNSPGPRAHLVAEAASYSRGSRSVKKNAREQEEIDPKRKVLWDKVDTNPNAYYYRYKDPGEEVTKGKWRSDEKQAYLERLKHVGTEVGWGVFSQGIPGRVGYQCASFYRQLIESGDVEDDNYYINEKGKAVYKKPDKKKSAVKASRTISTKKPAKRDPKAPAKPITAYNAFAKAFCEETKAKQPDLSARELASMAGKAWGELPEMEKQKLKEQSEADKRRYEAEMTKYTPSEGYDATGRLASTEESVKENWTDSRLSLLASCILDGHSQSAASIVSQFKAKLSGTKISKKEIADKLHELGKKEKRAPDSKQIWYLREEFETLADETSKKAHAEFRATIAIKSKPKFDFSGDKRHSKYQKMLQDYKEISKAKLAETRCFIAKVNVDKWVEKRRGEPLQESVEDKDEIDLIIRCIQGSRSSREELVDQTFAKFPSDFITKQAIEDRVLLCAERKYYGSKKKAEQSSDAEFFVWEADNLNPFSKAEAKAIQMRRKELARLCAHLKCVDRIINLIETNFDEKNAQKIVNEENKVIKFVREEENRRQKAKAISQQQKKAQPKVTLNSFFQKKSPPANIGKSKAVEASSKPAEVVIIENEEDAIDRAIAKGTIKEPPQFKRCKAFSKKRPAREVECLNAEGKLEDTDVCKYAKKKLFQFYEDERPPYFGTWRKKSEVVRGRRPFAHDPSVADYSYDSGEDWEEPEDGESLASDREEEEETDELDKLDYKDGWLAGDGEVDYVDGEEGDHGVASEQLRERYSVGVVFEIHTSKLPKARNLLRYTIEGLPELPLMVPSVDDIQMELLSAKAKDKKDKKEQPQAPIAPAMKALKQKPKRANTAYMIFQTKNYQSYKAKHVSSTRAEVLRIMKEEWRSLPVEQKSEYIQASATDRIRFESELEALKSAAAKSQIQSVPVAGSQKTSTSAQKALVSGKPEKKKRDLENSTSESNSSAVKKRKIESSAFASWKQS